MYICIIYIILPYYLTCTKIKACHNPVITQHIKDRSRKPSIAQVIDEAGILAPPLMLKDETGVHFPLPHK